MTINYYTSAEKNELFKVATRKLLSIDLHMQTCLLDSLLYAVLFASAKLKGNEEAERDPDFG